MIKAIFGIFILNLSLSALSNVEKTTISPMVLIKSGSFLMGSDKGDPDESPVHKVTINYDFYMGKYEVTLGEYNKCVLAGSCREPLKDKDFHYMCLDDNCPVMKVSWNDAQDYVKWLSKQTGEKYRLPTEAEREYAARAGTNTMFSSGDNNQSLNDTSWYLSNSKYRTHKVGTKKPNPWGLHDMHGNVWEWCEDSFTSYNFTPKDGSAYVGQGKKVVRGGSWDNISKALRSANRGALPANFRNYFFGFRVVKEK